MDGMETENVRVGGMPVGVGLPRLLSRVDATERTIIELKQQQYSNAEIAERTGWNIRRVQRFLKDLQDSMHDSGG